MAGLAGKSTEEKRIELGGEWPVGDDGLPMVWQQDWRKKGGGYWVRRSKHRADSRAEKARKRRADPEGVRAATRTRGEDWRSSLRKEFLAAYGCMCAGLADGRLCPSRECNPDRLSVGHLLNDGREHRKRIGAGNNMTVSVLRDLKSRGWPKNEGIAPQCGSCQLEDLRIMLRNG